LNTIHLYPVPDDYCYQDIRLNQAASNLWQQPPFQTNMYTISSSSAPVTESDHRERERVLLPDSYTIATDDSSRAGQPWWWGRFTYHGRQADPSDPPIQVTNL